MEELIVNHLLFLVPEHLIHIILDIWELIDNQKECVAIVFEHSHFRLRSEVVDRFCTLQNAVMVDHLTFLEISLRPLVFDYSIHDEVHKFGRATLLANQIVGVELFTLQFFKVLRVEVVIAILQESIGLNGFHVEEFGQLSLQG